MMSGLFDPPTNPEPFDDAPAPAQRHSPTSVAAAEQIEPVVEILIKRVLYRVQACGMYGATDEELQTFLSIGGSTERPRRWELVNAGFIKDSGRTRRTGSGRASVVWVVT